LRISVICKTYLKSVDFDSEEVEFIDTVFEKVDEAILKMDGELLKEYYCLLDIGLKNRKKKYLNRMKDAPKCLKWNL